MVKCETKIVKSRFYKAFEWNGSSNELIVSKSWSQHADKEACGGNLTIYKNQHAGAINIQCSRCPAGSTSNVKVFNKLWKTYFPFKDLTSEFEESEIQTFESPKRSIKL